MPVTTPFPPIDFAALKFDFFELIDQTLRRMENGRPVVEIAFDSENRAIEVEERFNYLGLRRDLPYYFSVTPVRGLIYRVSLEVDEADSEPTC